MIKVSSLDFLNKKTFGTNIMLDDGRIVFKSDDKVTQERLLRLFFKQIYIEKNVVEEKIEAPELEPDLVQEIQEAILEQKEALEPELEESQEQLEFNKEQADKVSKYSVMLAESIGFSTKQLDELKQAAYYHKIGRTKFLKSDLSQKDFGKRQAIESYNILKNEMNLPEKVAEVAKLYRGKYDTTLIKPEDGIPYYHIVAITSYYEELISKNKSKDKTLMQMLQMGGNKFNVFILHKFINMMRNANE